MLLNETFALGSMSLSGYTAFGIGTALSFSSGVLGYTTRVAISTKESFDFSDMLIEGFANTASGALSFLGGMCGAISGVNIPCAPKTVDKIVKYHAGLIVFGVYPTKALISVLKNKLKEK